MTLYLFVLFYIDVDPGLMYELDSGQCQPATNRQETGQLTGVTTSTRGV